ncbi:hypothetical protein [Halomonas borealis]|uniref:hypothetical protein n=1 Tax=Halomonas borealis TaxID=2508710 RepID=UPI0010A0896B|nr:hypothetical protein [Halomonas borealis]
MTTKQNTVQPASDGEQHGAHTGELSSGITLDKLEKLARMASVGPWHVREMGGDCFVEAPGSPDMAYRLDVCGDDYTGHGDEEQRHHNMQYIAAGDPDAVIALIERLRGSLALEQALAARCDGAERLRDRYRAESRDLRRQASNAASARDNALAERDTAEEERDALAAHVERLIRGGRYLHRELQQWSLTERDPETSAAMSTWDVIVDGTPTTSLARRDAEKECYGMQEALEALEYMDREVGSDRGALDATRDELRARVADYRRQAEQAGMNGGET